MGHLKKHPVFELLSKSLGPWFILFSSAFTFRLKPVPNGKPSQWKALAAMSLSIATALVTYGRYVRTHIDFAKFVGISVFKNFHANFPLRFRIYLGQHSWHQVLWGSGIGSVLGVAWFFVVQRCLTPCFPWIVSWSVSGIMAVNFID